MATPKFCNTRSFGCRFAIILVLLMLAISTRLLPLAISEYPFNNDSVTECVAASDILQAGRLSTVDGHVLSQAHSILTPAYDVLLAFFTALVGSSPFAVAQYMVALLSVLSVAAGFAISLQITRNVRGSLSTGLVLALYGTFVFVTGSAWKTSLGISLLLLLVFVYMNRHGKKMLFLEILILAILPLTHHLVTVVAYLALAYLAAWSFAYAIRGAGIQRRQITDLSIVGVLSLATYMYYYVGSFERIGYIDDAIGFGALAAIFCIFSTVLFLYLRIQNKPKITFAVVPALFVFVLFTLDYFNPVFSYTQSAPVSVFILTASMCVLIALAWFGFGQLRASKSPYRAIPLCFLLPVLTLFVFALTLGTGTFAHQIIYRSFDFADISLGLGVGVTVAYLRVKPKLQKTAVLVLMIVLIVSFPFSYLTDPLSGVRHDTQSYEVDAIDWVFTKAGPDIVINSDERLSYVAKAIYDLGKNPYLALDLSVGELPNYVRYNLLLKEWASIGVNAYPNGRVVIDEAYLGEVLQVSNTLYVGGPEENTIIVFRLSALGDAAA